MIAQDRGIFPPEVSKESGKFTDYGLISSLKTIFDKRAPVLDLGCGLGYYASELEKAGYMVAAMDGTPGINEFSVFKRILPCDLSQPIPAIFAEHSASVLCLEVGEHVPAEFQEVFLDNVTRQAQRLVLSWAIPGQGGHGHVNERTNEWVCDRMEERGMFYRHGLTGILRVSIGTLCTYFRNTLMVFDWEGGDS